MRSRLAAGAAFRDTRAACCISGQPPKMICYAARPDPGRHRLYTEGLKKAYMAYMAYMKKAYKAYHIQAPAGVFCTGACVYRRNEMWQKNHHASGAKQRQLRESCVAECALQTSRARRLSIILLRLPTNMCAGRVSGVSCRPMGLRPGAKRRISAPDLGSPLTVYIWQAGTLPMGLQADCSHMHAAGPVLCTCPVRVCVCMCVCGSPRSSRRGALIIILGSRG